MTSIAKLAVKIKRSLLTVVLGLVLLTVLTPISVYGAETDPYILLDSDRGVSSLVSDVNTVTKSSVGLNLLRSEKGNSRKVYINKTDYLKLDTDQKREAMAYALDAIKNSSLTSRDRSRLYNFMEEQDEGTASAVRVLSDDVSTDIVTASSIVRPFTGPVSTFLGLMCIVIFFLLAVAITIDIFFLTIPMFQAFVMRDNRNRPTYISQEAWDAMLYAEQNLGTGKASVWGSYFKSRSRTLIIVGITLGYLIGGKVFDFATFIVDVFLSLFN